MDRDLIPPASMLRTAATLLIALAVTGCVRAQDCSPFAESFFTDQGWATVPERFRELDYESKYSVFLCGMTKEAPNSVLIEEFAREGRSAALFLAGKLQTEPNEGRVLDILRVFELMKLYETFDVMADVEIRALVQRRASELTVPILRQQADGILRRLSAQAANVPSEPTE